MTEIPDREARPGALEARVDIVSADAQTAPHLAAARDGDPGDLGPKVDANRAIIGRLGDQLNTRVGQLERRIEEGFERMQRGIGEIRGRLDGTAADQQVIVDLLNRLVDHG